MNKIADFNGGYVAQFGDNELAIVSTIADPAKVRIGIAAPSLAAIESNLGSVAFDWVRPDGGHEELGYIMGRLTADKQEAAMYIALRPRGSQDCREVMYIDPGVAIFHVPIQAPNVGESSAPAVLRSNDGRLVLAAQDDGNLVLYKDGVAIKAIYGLPDEQLW